MKAVCGLGRTNYGGLRNVRPPLLHTLFGWKLFKVLHLEQQSKYVYYQFNNGHHGK